MNDKNNIRPLFEAVLLDRMKRTDEGLGTAIIGGLAGYGAYKLGNKVIPAVKKGYNDFVNSPVVKTGKKVGKALMSGYDKGKAWLKKKMNMESNDITVDFLVRITEMMKPEGKPMPKDPKKDKYEAMRKKYVPGGGINPTHAPKTNIKKGNIKEESYQPGKAKSPDKYGVRRGTAKLSKSSIQGVTRGEAEHTSRRNQERDFHRQRDAKFRKKHGSMSAAERRRENKLMNRPMGLRKKDPEDHYPQD